MRWPEAQITEIRNKQRRQPSRREIKSAVDAQFGDGLLTDVGQLLNEALKLELPDDRMSKVTMTFLWNVLFLVKI